MPVNNMPSASVAGRTLSKICDSINPAADITPNTNRKIAPCSRQLRTPLTTSCRGNRTPFRKKSTKIAAEEIMAAIFAAAPRTGRKLASNIVPSSKRTKRSAKIRATMATL
jgi:hypothetical protein